MACYVADVFRYLRRWLQVGSRAPTFYSQPDDAVPRFGYESHVHSLVAERRWPASTQQISELRVIVEYQSRSGYQRKLTLDIVDYPGEWLLDLPLLTKSYAHRAAESLRLSRQRPRAKVAAAWHSHLATLNPVRAEDEQTALTAALSSLNI